MTTNTNQTTNTISTLQQPVGSGFNSASTTGDVIKGIDLSGKIAIVTGGYIGLGLETVRTFAAAGATVIVPARDTAKARDGLQHISGIEIEQMDLMDPASIETFTARFLTSGRPLHILVNNAGIMAAPLRRDSRGYESQFSTNHLGHFQLTAGLWPALKQAKGARVVNVSSWSHRSSPIVFEDLNFEQRDYNPITAYGQSKTANILFSLALDEYGKKDNIRAYSLHPGSIVETDLVRFTPREILIQYGLLDENGDPIRDLSRGRKTIPQGAATTVWCATSPALDGIGGVYAENSEIAELITEGTVPPEDGSKSVGVMFYAVDYTNAERLWQVSEQLTGVSFQ